MRDLPVMTGQKAVVRLGDLARVTRGYVDPPMQILRYNGSRRWHGHLECDRHKCGRGAAISCCASESDRPIGIEIHEFTRARWCRTRSAIS